MKNCPYSLSEDVPQYAGNVPVRCPLCGATRKTWHRRGARSVFRSHDPLDGIPIDRDHYERIDGVWKLVKELKKEEQP